MLLPCRHSTPLQRTLHSEQHSSESDTSLKICKAHLLPYALAPHRHSTRHSKWHSNKEKAALHLSIDTARLLTCSCPPQAQLAAQQAAQQRAAGSTSLDLSAYAQRAQQEGQATTPKLGGMRSHPQPGVADVIEPAVSVMEPAKVRSFRVPFT